MIAKLLAAVLTASTPSAEAEAEPAIAKEIIRDDDGGVFLRQSLVLPVNVTEAWSLFTTQDGVMRWMAPVAEVDLSIGGSIKTNYDPCAAIDDPGMIELAVVNYVPGRFLTLQADLDGFENAPWMAPEIFERRNRLFNIIEFQPIDAERTKVISWGIGYREGPAWQTMIDFFIRGNEWSYGQLYKAAQGGQAFGACETETGSDAEAITDE